MWVIGNGESRKTISIDRLTGIRIGCNAIIRECSVDHLVCVDRRMVDEVIQSNANLNSLIYTRAEWHEKYSKFLHVRQLPDLPYASAIRADEPFQWGSGPYALLLGAMKTDCDFVNMLGFDLYSKTGKINNIYKDTQGYDSGNKRAVDPRYWIHQIGMVFQHFPSVHFVVYQEDEWKIPQSWILPNVTVDKISNIS